MDLSDRLSRLGVVPVVAIPDGVAPVALGEALLEGGLACAEITFRTPGAAAAISAMRAGLPGMLVGAGTVLSTAQADAAIDAGAQFVVAPGTNLAVVDHVLERGVPMLPGVATPTEIEAVLAHGIGLVKFFPAEQFGGVTTVRAFAGPYREARYVPTGGIGPHNLASYLALEQVVACGGSWMVPPETLAAGDLATVTRLAREALEIVTSVRSPALAR